MNLTLLRTCMNEISVVESLCSVRIFTVVIISVVFIGCINYGQYNMSAINLILLHEKNG